MSIQKEARETANKRRQVILIFISLFCVLFITLLSRVPTLTRTIHLIPLWSFTSHGHGRQILLNIALFIPLGYFLASSFESTRHPRVWPIITALATSAGIELTQFLTYRGMLDGKLSIIARISFTIAVCKNGMDGSISLSPFTTIGGILCQQSACIIPMLNGRN